MSAPKDGGPAFPSAYGGEGMDLRDFFAAKAMQSYADYQMRADLIEQPSDKEVAEWAYAMADAMLAERAK